MHAIRRFMIGMMAFWSIQAPAQFLRQVSFEDQVNYLDTTYRALPLSELQQISDYLDSTAIAEQCFKYIISPDQTKTIAFYLTRKDNPVYELLNKEQSLQPRSVINAGNGEVYFGYTVYGMKFENQWYYINGSLIEIQAANEADAKNNFLIHSLIEKDFFAWKGEKENKKFWQKNEFECDQGKKTGLTATPLLVQKAIRDKEKRTQQILDNKLRCIANRYYNSLWKELQEFDPLTYHSRFDTQGENCLHLFNPERNMILLPVIYFDKKEKPWISYFLLKCSPSDTLLFHWDLAGTKPVDWPRGNEDRAIVYDMRKFTDDKNWEKTNMIADKNFWNRYFSRNDILLIETSISKTSPR